ncbi:MAG: GTP pyrophosphokinase family protein [Oscillospiraceae bacterium]|nr:GTP pyrophosphokinase family protein [Oscillospiraceae bacterium]
MAEPLNNHIPFITDSSVIDWLQERGLEMQRLMTYYRCAMLEVETKFKVLDAEYSMQHDRNPINSVKTRLKKFESIIEKLERRNLPFSINSIEENLNDIAGVRVICSFVEDVYTLAEALLNQDDVQLIERKDYIQNPKSNGYRSLHLIVAIPIFLENEKRMMKVEIQLRTIAMDCWASLEHQLHYKKDYEFDDESMAKLYECAQLSMKLDTIMDELRAKSNI